MTLERGAVDEDTILLEGWNAVADDRLRTGHRLANRGKHFSQGLCLRGLERGEVTGLIGELRSRTHWRAWLNTTCRQQF